MAKPKQPGSEQPEGGNPGSVADRNDTQINRSYVFLVALVAAIGGFLFGYDLVIISGANLYLKEQFQLNEAQFGFASTSAIFGCIAGPFLGMWFCDWIGRKNTMIFSALLFVVSAIGTALPPTGVFWAGGRNFGLDLFNVFRIVGGLGVGLCSIASPMYINEMAPARLRGGLGIMYQLAISIGALSAAITAFLLARSLPETLSWRWMFGSECVAIAIFLVFLLIVPESPRWLSEKGRRAEAFSVIERIGGRAYAEREQREIEESLSAEEGGFGEIFQGGMPKALGVGLLLAVFNNWTGWSAMGYYMPSLFQMGGFSRTTDAIFQTIYVQIWCVLLTLLAIYLVDRAGRRALWKIGSLSMIVAMIIAWAIFRFHITGWPVLVAVFICGAPHAMSLGPLPWLMMSELYPTRIRAKAVAITTTVIWITGWSGPFLFPIIAGHFERTQGNIGPTFLIFVFTCALAYVFGSTLLPETKGRTLEEIARSWQAPR